MNNSDLDKLENIIVKEGDKKRFEAFGYKCLIKRNHYTGGLCGYVGVSRNSKLYRMSYQDLEDKHNIDVHGGLTFSDFWSEETDDLWYVGFDAGHYMDVMPFMARECKSLLGEGTYKDMGYMTKECKSLAKQLSELNISD